MDLSKLNSCETQTPRRTRQQSTTRRTDTEVGDARTQAALDHIEHWRARNARRNRPYVPWHVGPQRWAQHRGYGILMVLVGVGSLLMLAGWLFGHGLYDVGEALALGGGGLFGQILFALETGGVPV
ncbi:MAG TPA: hypothetical protein VK034_13250 [Enhygromyxa sp.]|nr:hypothetical protein [Enhygromyxa sp.]